MPSILTPNTEPKTKVMFRHFKGEVLALMPESPADYQGLFCDCYAQIGQHGSADFHVVIQNSKPARGANIEALKKEMEGLGYNIQVIEKVSQKMRDKFKSNLKEINDLS